MNLYEKNIFWYYQSYTVEPLLKDTPNKGHLCYKGHLPEPQMSCYSYFLPPTRGHLIVKDKKQRSIGVHLIGAPLYAHAHI